MINSLAAALYWCEANILQSIDECPCPSATALLSESLVELGLSKAEASSFGRYWERRSLTAAQVIWTEEDPALAVFVERGELEDNVSESMTSVLVMSGTIAGLEKLILGQMN